MFSKTLASLSALAIAARAVTFTVESSGGNATSPFQYGIMYEDINNSGDGGVYAELVQNRGFQGNTIYPANLWWWHPIGGAQLALSNLSDPLSSALPSSMQVTGGTADEVGFWNEGSLSQVELARAVLISCQASGAFPLYLHGSIRARSTSMESLMGILPLLWCRTPPERPTHKRQSMSLHPTRGRNTNTRSSLKTTHQTATILCNSRCQLRGSKVH